MRPIRLFRFTSIAAALALAGCAGQAWEQVRKQDSLAAYRHFVSEHPSSSHAAEAQERIAVLQIERDPTPEALERFRHDHPASAATADLTQRLETRMFDAARADASPAAYDRFLAAFPDGELADRARGNVEYLRAGGFAGRPDALATFAAQHPTSDYAAEAQRTLAATQARSNARLGAVALRIEIAPGVGEADRLRNQFSERAHEIYAAAGVPLVDGAANATLTIRHDEHAASAHDNDGRLARSGVVAETTVSLQRNGDPEPIWVEPFRWSVPDVDRRTGGSALFSHSGAGYWEHFFVPVASWPTQAAHRPAWDAGVALAGVATSLGRAIAVAPDGSFRELDLADPTAPRVVAHYRRPNGVARFSGVRSIGDRVVLFGEDGVEVVARQGSAYRLVFGLDRGTVGAVADVEVVDGQLLAAGTRGLMRVALDGGPAERLVERPLRGMARQGDRLLLLDDNSIYAGPVHDPRPASLATVADLGRGMEPRGLRADHGLAVVFGPRGVACFDVSGDATARPLAYPRASALGNVTDAVVLGGSVFVIGERGLQVVDPIRGRVVDEVDVKARLALDGAGGHLVAIGGNDLEVVDATPWIARQAPASPAP